MLGLRALYFADSSGRETIEGRSPTHTKTQGSNSLAVLSSVTFASPSSAIVGNLGATLSMDHLDPPWGPSVEDADDDLVNTMYVQDPFGEGMSLQVKDGNIL